MSHDHHQSAQIRSEPVPPCSYTTIVAARPITAALASCHCCERNFDNLGPKLILHSDLRCRVASRRALPCPSSYY